MTLALDDMDSKTVNREIRKTIWPALKAAGFSHFTSRVAWRHHADSIDVIEFQSFNKYNAEALGVTTFSFCVNLGKFPRYVPPCWAPKTKEGIQLPSQAECLFRGSRLPTINPAASHPNLWSIDKEGRNLLWCIRDVQSQLPAALEWFARLDDRAEVLRILLENDEDMSALWGFGRNPSPLRAYHAGYVALALGDNATATAMLQEAVDSNCFVHLFSSVQGAMARAL